MNPEIVHRKMMYGDTDAMIQFVTLARRNKMNYPVTLKEVDDFFRGNKYLIDKYSKMLRSYGDEEISFLYHLYDSVGQIYKYYLDIALSIEEDDWRELTPNYEEDGDDLDFASYFERIRDEFEKESKNDISMFLSDTFRLFFDDRHDLDLSQVGQDFYLSRNEYDEAFSEGGGEYYTHAEEIQDIASSYGHHTILFR